MRYPLRLLASTLSLILLLTPSLTADTVSGFSVSGTFTDNTTLSGTFSVDITTGVVTAADFDYQEADFGNLETAPSTPPAFSVFEFPDTFAPVIQVVFEGTSNPNPLIGYAGGSICSTTNLCPVPGTGGDELSAFIPATGPSVFLESGTITPIPEPSSIMLLGTGLMAALWCKLRT